MFFLLGWLVSLMHIIHYIYIDLFNLSLMVVLALNSLIFIFYVLSYFWWPVVFIICLLTFLISLLEVIRIYYCFLYSCNQLHHVAWFCFSLSLLAWLCLLCLLCLPHVVLIVLVSLLVYLYMLLVCFLFNIRVFTFMLSSCFLPWSLLFLLLLLSCTDAISIASEGNNI